MQKIKQELLEHTSQILTAISLKSKTLEQRLIQAHPQEAHTAKEIRELAGQLIVRNRHMAQRLCATQTPDKGR